jgi:hypothetical protein
MKFLVFCFAVLLASLGWRAAAAQDRAVESITEEDVRRRVGLIAHDSMGGRATPSRGLDLTAQYIAGEFARLGLKPAGDSGSFVQWYSLNQSRIDAAKSSLTLTAGHVTVVAKATRDFVQLSGARSNTAWRGDVLLLAALTETAARAAPVEGRITLLVAPTRAGRPSASIVQILTARGAAAIIAISGVDTVAFARQVASQQRDRVSRDRPQGAGPLLVSVHERALGSVLETAGVSLASLRASDTPVVRDLPMEAVLRVSEHPGSSARAPNVAAILRGTDPVLRDEYLVFSAHMDHVGINPSAGADSIFNGADDDASGTAGVLELAEAYSRAGARPKRSLIFLTVSGEERGLWGSDHFVRNAPVPIGQIVANINMDMIGRNWRDTIAVIGREHSDLGATLARVNAEHPELGMTAIDDIWPQENFYFRSDHYNFAKRGVPILFFFNGTHADYHRPGDAPERIDAEKEARLLRLIYYLGLEVGNATERPKWDEESYRAIVK